MASNTDKSWNGVEAKKTSLGTSAAGTTGKNHADLAQVSLFN